MRTVFRATVLLAALAVAPPAYSDTTIAANTTVQGRLERGDSRRDGYFVDTYTYAGEAGEELRIAMGYGANPRLLIEGPGGFSSQHSEVRNGALNARLPRRGRYRISVSYHLSVDYELTVWRLISEQAPAALVLGQTIQGGLTSTDHPAANALRQDNYTYTARAGEAVAFQLEGETPRFSVESVRVTGANEFSQHWSPGMSQSHSKFRVYFPLAGEYGVHVTGPGGNYTFSLQPEQFAATATPAAHLLLGNSVPVAVQPANVVNERSRVVNVYTIDARRGDRIAVVLSIDIDASLRGPDGHRLSGRKFTDRPVGGVARYEFDIPATGQYRIEAPVLADHPYVLQVVSGAQGAAAMAEATANAERVRAQARAELEARVAPIIQRGEQLLNSGDNQAAAQAFEEALSIDYTSMRALLGAGVASYRMGAFTGARVTFEAALEREPNNQSIAAALEASRQAEIAQQRDWQAYRDRRLQEDSQAVQNALGAFVGTYNAVTTARLQAEADAAARAQAAQQAAAARTPPQQQPASSGGSSGGSTARGPGANGCAEKSGNRILNRCDYSISVAVAAVINNRTESEINHIGPNGSQTTVQQARILASCNYDPSSSTGARGAVLTAGGGAECR